MTTDNPFSLPLLADVGAESFSLNGNGSHRPHAPRPVFVIGSRRSGASLLTLSLGQHPMIRMIPDMSWVERFARGAAQAYGEDAESGDLSQFQALGITPNQMFEDLGVAIDRMMLRTPDHLRSRRHPTPVNGSHPSWRDFGREHVGAAHAAKPARWVDGCDTHCFIVLTLQRLFPEARFIHVVREVEEVVASLTNPDNEMVYKSRHLLFSRRDAYEHWLDAVYAGLEAERALGSRMVLRVRRQDLVSSPEATLQRVFGFIEEPFVQLCMRPFQSIPRRATSAPAVVPAAMVDEDISALRRQAGLLSFVLMNDPSPLLPRAGDQAIAQVLESQLMRESG